MNYLSSLVKGVTKFASGINPATLSGAIDILFIEQEDGTFQSSPFYVRFGKIGVASCTQKEVDIEINGEEIDLDEAINLSMLLDDYGVAHFIDAKDRDTIADFDDKTTIPNLVVDEVVEPKADRTTIMVPEKLRKLDTGQPYDPNEDRSPEGEEAKDDGTLEPQDVFKKFRNLETRVSFDLSNETEESLGEKPEVEDQDSVESIGEKIEKLGDILLDTSSQVVENSAEEDVTLRKNTLGLTSEELKNLNLVKGYNEVTFSITTQYQGTTRCSCNVFVWHYKDKIVISDIDGTITKSDVRGMFLPMIAGFKWAQGDVTRLYSRINQNGYHMAYLSARAIGQAGATKEYINWLKQDELCLPKGPLFLNPKSLMRTFNQEVITRTPEVFKIECLKHIQECFGGNNPFYAGYGNRPNDVVAYQEVGIPMSRIYIINKAGSVQGGIHLNQTSYRDQSTVVDHIYPPLDSKEVDQDQDPSMNSYMFWKVPLPDVDFEAV